MLVINQLCIKFIFEEHSTKCSNPKEDNNNSHSYHNLKIYTSFYNSYTHTTVITNGKGRAQLKPDGTWWYVGGEVKGKQANGVGSQYSSTLPRNMVCPAFLTTIKTYNKLSSSMVSCELSSKNSQFQHLCFHITLSLLMTQSFQLFPVLWYDMIYDMIYLSTAIGLTPAWQ